MHQQSKREKSSEKSKIRRLGRHVSSSAKTGIVTDAHLTRKEEGSNLWETLHVTPGLPADKQKIVAARKQPLQKKKKPAPKRFAEALGGLKRRKTRETEGKSTAKKDSRQ